MQRDRISTPLLTSGRRDEVDWISLLDVIGTEQFEPALKRFLAALVGYEGCAAFFHEALGEVVTGCDCPQQGSLCASPHWIHFNDGPWRAAIAVALSRNLDWTESSELSRRLACTGGALSAILRKHIGEVALETKKTAPAPCTRPGVGDVAAVLHERFDGEHGRGDASEPLCCLSTIEQCLADCTNLPTRELEVCSRILHGLSSTAIAIDLHLCDSTIKTYRKRAYQRLSIGSERELLTWYLSKWVRWLRNQDQTGARPHVARNKLHVV